MRTNLTEGFWANLFLQQIENREFNLVTLDRKTLAALMDADYTSVEGWINMKNRLSAEKVEKLILRLPPAAFQFLLDFQAAMRSSAKPEKSAEAERAELSMAAAKLEATIADAMEDGAKDDYERQQLRLAGSVFISEAQDFVNALVTA